MILLNKTAVFTSGFDQNRFFTGPFFEADGGTRVEFGYMNFLVNRHDMGFHDSHIAMVNLFVPLKIFQKKKEPQISHPTVGSDIVDPQ